MFWYWYIYRYSWYRYSINYLALLCFSHEWEIPVLDKIEGCSRQKLWNCLPTNVTPVRVMSKYHFFQISPFLSTKTYFPNINGYGLCSFVGMGYWLGLPFAFSFEFILRNHLGYFPQVLLVIRLWVLLLGHNWRLFVFGLFDVFGPFGPMFLVRIIQNYEKI